MNLSPAEQQRVIAVAKELGVSLDEALVFLPWILRCLYRETPVSMVGNSRFHAREL